MKLKDISTIQTGYFGKTSIHPNTLYLQVKDFNNVGGITNNIVPELNSEEITERHFLRKGDILFAAKGSNNFATIFNKLKQPTVASTSFFIIRVLDKNILPEYLSWFINTKETLEYLKSFSKGTSIPSISIKTIKELEVPIPSIEKQKNIIKLVELGEKQKEINHKIEKLNELKLKQQLFNAIK